MIGSLLCSGLLLGVLTLDPAASYGEDARTATIAVSSKGRVALAVAMAQGVELVDWTKAAGPRKRWALNAPVAAGGEDRPQVGFDGEAPWIAALRKDGDLVVIRPERNDVSRVGAASRERECAVAGGLIAGWSVLAWTQGGAAYGGFAVRSTAYAAFPLDERVCPCCRPGVAVGENETAFFAYRDELDGGVRDIFLRKWTLGKPFTLSPAVRVSTEGFRSDQCPMAGPAVLALDEKIVIVAYVVPLDHGKSPELKVAVSADGGATFGPAVKVASGRKPQLAALAGGKAIALAFDGAPDGAFVAISRNGGASWSAPERVDEGKAGFAASGIAIAATPDGDAVWVSWIDHDKQGGKRAVTVRRATLAAAPKE